jgi:hypothetical protein
MRGVFLDGAAGGITSLDLPARGHGALSQAYRPDVEVEVLGGSKRGSRCRVGHDEQAERVNAGLPERRRGRGYRDEAMGGGQDEDVAAGRKAAKVSSVTPMAPQFHMADPARSAGGTSAGRATSTTSSSPAAVISALLESSPAARRAAATQASGTAAETSHKSRQAGTER